MFIFGIITKTDWPVTYLLCDLKVDFFLFKYEANIRLILELINRFRKWYFLGHPLLSYINRQTHFIMDLDDDYQIM